MIRVRLARPRLCFVALVCALALARLAGPAGVAADKLPDDWVRVVRVIDGDTVDVDADDGRIERIRVIGIDSPEVYGRTVECFGPEASALAKDWLADQWVWLESDPVVDDRDRFGRWLRYLWLEAPDGWWDFGHELIRAGHAREYTYRRPYRYRAAYRAAQAEARASEQGLWAPGACAA